MKPGANAGGKPKGDRFKDIRDDLKAMVEGRSGPEGGVVPATQPAKPVPEVKVNVPLKDSENERARALTELDRKFVVDIGEMNPKASAYFRRRTYLTPEVCRAWRMGYLPRDTGGEDKSGGTMRGKIVYPYLSEAGEVLSWFGRDPEFDEKHKKWESTDKKEREPEKFHFVKGFHRGLELFGAHRLRAEGVQAKLAREVTGGIAPVMLEVREKLANLGLVVVEGPNDVIRLDTLGVPAVGLCSNTTTREQAVKAARLAREVAGGIVTVMLDLDPEGENGMRQCLGYLAQLTPVRLAWSPKMYGGKFRGIQPEGLNMQQWQEIEAYLRSGKPEGWSLS
jgi:5S rRNA maturation endonuclease (ribonuclease M5)